MGTWARTGPVVVELDGSAEALHVVDYAALEAIRSGAELVIAAPYQAHSSFNAMAAGDQPKPPAEFADASLRVAVAHVRHHYGYGLAVTDAIADLAGLCNDAFNRCSASSSARWASFDLPFIRRALA